MGLFDGIQLDDLVLAGAHLTLRPWRATDADAVYDAMQDPHMHRFLPLPDPYTREDAHRFAAEQGNEGRLGGTGFGNAVVETATGRVIGAAAIRFPKGREIAADIGYWIGAAGRGRGFATEASRMLAEWAFQHGVSRVEIRCAVGNLASAGAAMRAGFHYEATHRDNAPTPSGPADEAVFARLASDSGNPVPPSLPQLPDAGLTDGTVLLRITTAADAPLLIEEARDAEARRWAFDDTIHPERASHRTAERAGLDWMAGSLGRLTIVDAATGEAAGTMQLRTVGPPHIGGVGYGVRAKFRGRGCTARALRLLSTWAFEDAGFARLELGAKEGNVASQKAAYSGGFEPDGVRAARLRNPDGTYSDEVRFARVNPGLPRSGRQPVNPSAG